MPKHQHLVLDLETGEIRWLALPADAGAAPDTNNAVLGWGAGKIGSSPTTRYLYPWYSDLLAEVGELGFHVPRPGTLRNLRVVHNIPSGNGNNIVYTLRISGSDSVLKVTLPSTSASGSNTTNTVVVAAGDLISIKVTKASAIGASPRNIAVTAEFV
jgi:hypothetical protein